MLALAIVFAAPAVAEPPPSAALNSTDAILKWINAYRAKPEPEALPVLVRALSERQAFEDAETCGAYLGFIAGVLGANPDRAAALVAKMLPIAPADHWVLVRAIAYSGLVNWKELLATFADRMPTRRAMIDKYLDGKLPTLDQIAYQPSKPGMLDKIKRVLKIDNDRKQAVAIEPSPELIDVLWGSYLATGSDQPVVRIIKLLPLAKDKDSVDILTTGSAAKFTLASNAVRDLRLLAILKREVKNQPEPVVAVLNEVIETAETVDTARMRKESSPRSTSSSKRPGLQTRADRLGSGGAGRPGDGLRRRRRHWADRARHPLRGRRRGLLGRDAVHRSLIPAAAALARRREVIDANRLIETAAMRGVGLGEAATHFRRQHGFLAVAVEPHVGDHAIGKGVEIGIAPLIGVTQDLASREMRPGKTVERYRCGFAHRRLVMERRNDIVMRALRERFSHIKSARRPQHPTGLGERGLQLFVGHMMQRENKHHEIGLVVDLGNGVGRRLDQTITAGAVLGPGGLGDERIAAGDPRAQRRERARQASFAAADIDDVEPGDRADRRRERIEMRHGAEIARGRFRHGFIRSLLRHAGVSVSFE